MLAAMCVLVLLRQVCNSQIFNAAKAPTRSAFDREMATVKERKPASFEAIMKIPLEKWTNHASSQDTVILDQVTSNLAEATMNMVGAQVSAKYSKTA